MKIEKAIELFENCDTVTFTVTGCGEESYQTIEFENVVEALEKQIAKKPKQYTDIFKMTYYFCPICCEYVRITGNQKRCDVCGQKLDWSEVENE